MRIICETFIFYNFPLFDFEYTINKLITNIKIRNVENMLYR